MVADPDEMRRELRAVLERDAVVWPSDAQPLCQPGHVLGIPLGLWSSQQVIKVGNVCSSMKGGRSAIIAPWGILEEVSAAPKDAIVTVDLDLQRLREYRKALKK